MLLLDTLFAIHRITPNQAFSLWHALLIGDNLHEEWVPKDKLWKGQKGRPVNFALGRKYREEGMRNPERMRAIIAEWLRDSTLAHHHI